MAEVAALSPRIFQKEERPSDEKDVLQIHGILFRVISGRGKFEDYVCANDLMLPTILSGTFQNSGHPRQPVGGEFHYNA